MTHIKVSVQENGEKFEVLVEYSTGYHFIGEVFASKEKAERAAEQWRTAFKQAKLKVG